MKQFLMFQEIYKNNSRLPGNKHIETKIKNTFTTSLKKMNYLSINLTKHVQDLYTVEIKTL